MGEYKKLGEKLVYKSRLVELYDDYLMLPDGREVTYDLVRHAGGAAVLPIDEEGNVILIRQYRNSIDDMVYEIPAGLKEAKDASGEACAMRELEEEVGYRTEKLHFIAEVYGCIGVSDEKTMIYYADQLIPCERHPDPDEYIEIHKFDLDTALNMIRNKEIVDSKTVIAILYYNSLKKQVL